MSQLRLVVDRDTTSVVICTHNYGHFLPECIESVLAQSHQPTEILVVDDGSTDETRQIVGSYPTVTYLRRDQSGKAAAFNQGIDQSVGAIICHLDADDYWYPTKLERIVSAFRDHPETGGVIHGADYMRDGRIERVSSNGSRGFFSFLEVLERSFIYPLVSAPFPGVANTISVKRTSVEDLIPIPLEVGLAVDGYLIFAAARIGLVFLPDSLSVYRMHSDSFFRTRPQARRDQVKLLETMRAWSSLPATQVANLIEAKLLEEIAYISMESRTERLEALRAAIRLPFVLLAAHRKPNARHWLLAGACAFGLSRFRRPSRVDA